jgi:hypothetical protein
MSAPEQLPATEPTELPAKPYPICGEPTASGAPCTRRRPSSGRPCRLHDPEPRPPRRKKPKPPAHTAPEGQETPAPETLPPLEPSPHGGKLYRGAPPGGWPGAGTPELYTPEACAVVERVGKEGGSLNEMALECGVSGAQTLHEWAERHPEFAVALIRARLHSLVWWEKTGRGGLWSGKERFDGRHWSRMVAGLFPEQWTERQSIELKGTIAGLSVAQLPDEALVRMAAGEHPLAVLASMAQARLTAGPPTIEAEVEPG